MVAAGGRLPFRYRAYGLTLASSIELPELRPSDAEPVVTVRSGPVPAVLDAPHKTGALFQAAPGEYLLRIAGIGAYWVRGGTDIVIEAAPECAAATVRSFLLGSPLTALLHQRGALVLHAAAMAGGRGAVLIAGHSGAGKSTTVATLMRRGHRVLADDAAAVVSDAGGGLTVHPGFPQINLWRDALDRLGESGEAMPRARERIDKYQWPIGGSFIDVPQRPAHLVILGLSNEAGVRSEPVVHRDAFLAIRGLTRNRRAAEGLGVAPRNFSVTTSLAATVPILRLTRPRGSDTTGEIADTIAALLD